MRESSARATGSVCAVSDEGHKTHYNATTGCFPLCEKCWVNLETPDARLPFYQEMWDSWNTDIPMEPSGWIQIRNAVLEGK